MDNPKFILIDEGDFFRKGEQEDVRHVSERYIAKSDPRYRSEGLGNSWSDSMKIVPVNFNSEHKAILGHCKMILENEGGRVAINTDKFDKLITSLRTAVDNELI